MIKFVRTLINSRVNRWRVLLWWSSRTFRSISCQVFVFTMHVSTINHSSSRFLSLLFLKSCPCSLIIAWSILRIKIWIYIPFDFPCLLSPIIDRLTSSLVIRLIWCLWPAITFTILRLLLKRSLWMRTWEIGTGRHHRLCWCLIMTLSVVRCAWSGRYLLL